MAYLHCPRCSTRISANVYSALDRCPYCLAQGIYPAPFLRRGLPPEMIKQKTRRFPRRSDKDPVESRERPGETS